jgi:hypothetical protein
MQQFGISAPGALLRCEKLNASHFFRDIDSSSGVFYVPSALADADIAWGTHGDPLGEGNAFIRNAHVAQASGLRRFHTTSIERPHKERL